MRKFFKDKSGNVAVTTAVIALPLLLSAGAALDFSRYSTKNSDLQNAVDAAILALGHEAQTKTNEELMVIAHNYLRSNLPADHYAQIVDVRLERFDDGKRLRLTADATVPTSMMQMVGIPKLDYSPDASINLLGGTFEVALVLDSTYSMNSDGKINALKTAASDFVTDLTYFNALEDKVKIGIVPFAKYVNVGTEHRNASWINVPADSSENICRMQRSVVSKSGCSTTTRYNDGVPYQAETCSNVTYGEETEVCSTVTTTWHGCVGSRPSPLNIEDRSYGTRVPGIMNETCGNALTPLKTDKNSLLSAVSSLTPQGDTYIPAGLTWGLRILSSQTPFTDGAPYDPNSDTTKVVVLMSDGENVRSISSGDKSRHDGSNTSAANDVTLDLCEEIRDNDIIVYTIGFGDSIPTETEQMLVSCSTDGKNYYPARNAQALSDAFNSISKKITALYLSE